MTYNPYESPSTHTETESFQMRSRPSLTYSMRRAAIPIAVGSVAFGAAMAFRNVSYLYVAAATAIIFVLAIITMFSLLYFIGRR